MEGMLRGIVEQIGTLPSDVERNTENMNKNLKAADEAEMAKLEMLTTEASVSVSRFRYLFSAYYANTQIS